MDDMWAEDKSDTAILDKQDKVRKDYQDNVDKTDDKLSKQKGPWGMFAQK